MFCDLVGSTALSEEFDPEDYRDLITRYRELVDQTVAKFGGEIANYAGDGVVAIFGYPIAQELSHYSAGLCGLEISSKAQDLDLGFSTQTVAMNVRVGIHTGPVVVGTATSASMDEKVWLFGDTPNIAARIQSLAEIGDVLVSEVTRRLIGERLAYASVGSPSLAGISKPIEIFKLSLKLAGFEEAGEALAHVSTPIIGRTAETALVRSRWEGALEGEGQVLLLSGDAGVGKSKIAFGLKEEIAGAESSQFVLFGSPLHSSSAFFPIKNALTTLIGVLPNDAPDKSRGKVQSFMSDLGLDDETCSVPILRLLGLEDSATPHEPMAPEREKRALIDALLLLCAGLAAHRPLLVLLDDVHWFDASTLEFVNALINQVSNRRCLILLTARSEFKSPWRSLPHVTSLELNRLSRRDIFKMVESISGMRPAEEVLDQLAERTDGVPLFVEELTKMAMESGVLAGSGPSQAEFSSGIPESLQDSLMTRLDRLSTNREIVQVASAIGRVFDRQLLSEVLDWREGDIASALDQLLDTELIVPVGQAGGDDSYRFRHALVQDAAYQSMLRSTAATWHGKIAAALEENHKETVVREPEILGHHYWRAGDHAAAETKLMTAARQALEHSANVEAITHLQHALKCLQKSEPSQDRDRREIDLQIMIAVPLAFVRGYAHDSVLSAYSRAQELCRAYGETERLFKVVYGQFRSNMLGGEYGPSQQCADRLTTLCADLASPLALVATERSHAALHTYLGRPAEALKHVDKGIGYKMSIEHRFVGLDFDVVDLSVALHGYKALSCWLAGDEARALDAIEAALIHAEETSHPFSQSFAHAFLGWIAQFRGDIATVQDSSAKLIALSEEYSFAFWRGWARVMNGWARRASDGETLLDDVKLGLSEWKDTGCRLGLSFFLYLYADAAIVHEQFDLAGDMLNDADQFAKDSGERFWIVGLKTLRGRLAIARGERDAGIDHMKDAAHLAAALGHYGPLLNTIRELVDLDAPASCLNELVDLVRSATEKTKENVPALTEAKAVLKSRNSPVSNEH
ncbi:MAG: adenylate/guanylate cyclase domain-containing protein [Pseudomonadota bacterium]